MSCHAVIAKCMQYVCGPSFECIHVLIRVLVFNAWYTRSFKHLFESNGVLMYFNKLVSTLDTNFWVVVEKPCASFS